MSWPEIPLKKLLTYLDKRIELQDMGEYITITIRRGHGGLEEREKLFGHQIKTKKQFRLIPGSFIISRVQCWHQAYAMVPDNLPSNMIASTNYDQFAISPDVDHRFFWWLSHSPAFTDSVRSSASGVVIEKMVFNREGWLEKTIPLPPLPEQRRIVAKIEVLAAKIAEARSLRHKAAEETEALVTSLHVKLAGKRQRELREVVVLDEDLVPVIPGEEYPQVGIKSFGAGLFKKSATKATDTTYKTFNRLYPGALVLSQVKGWEGAIAVAGDDLAGWFVSPEYRTFRCIVTEASPDYLAALVRTEWFWTRLQTATRGVGARRERTRPEQFLSIKIPMPDVNQQKSALAVFKRLDALKGLQSETATELDALLPAILDRAFKEEL
jgi:type I restriction enzyme, S subunit